MISHADFHGKISGVVVLRKLFNLREKEWQIVRLGKNWGNSFYFGSKQ